MFRRLSLSILCVFFMCNPAHAGINTLQALSFGEFVVHKNDAQYVLTINSNGTYSYDSASYILITAPEEGVYVFDSLTPAAVVTSVDVTEISPLTGSGDTLEMYDFQVINDSVVDVNGEIDITIGASLRTSGNGTPLASGVKTGTLQVTVNY